MKGMSRLQCVNGEWEELYVSKITEGNAAQQSGNTTHCEARFIFDEEVDPPLQLFMLCGT
jgi:hypothetical protein